MFLQAVTRAIQKESIKTYEGRILPKYASCVDGSTLRLSTFKLPTAKPLSLQVVRRQVFEGCCSALILFHV